MTAPSTHTDLVTLQKNMGALDEAGHTVGWTYVGLPSISDDLRRNLDDYKKMAEEFNRIGADAKRHGLKFAYHNHGYGLHEMEGKIPLRLLLTRSFDYVKMLYADCVATSCPELTLSGVR